MRTQFSERYAFIAGSHLCGANRENRERARSEGTSCRAPCSQRNLMLLIGSIGPQTCTPHAPFSTEARSLMHELWSKIPLGLCDGNFLPARLRSRTLGEGQSQHAFLTSLSVSLTSTCGQKPANVSRGANHDSPHKSSNTRLIWFRK